MPIETVPRARIPFKALKDFNEDATKEYDSLVDLATGIITREVETSTPPANQEALVASSVDLTQLNKATGLETRENLVTQALLDYERRARYGGPLLPARQLPHHEMYFHDQLTCYVLLSES